MNMKEFIQQVLEGKAKQYGQLHPEPADGPSMQPPPSSSMLNLNNATPSSVDYQWPGYTPPPTRAPTSMPAPSSTPQIYGPGTMMGSVASRPAPGTNPFAAKARAMGMSDFQPSTQSMQASALRGGTNG